MRCGDIRANIDDERDARQRVPGYVSTRALIQHDDDAQAVRAAERCRYATTSPMLQMLLLLRCCYGCCRAIHARRRALIVTMLMSRRHAACLFAVTDYVGRHAAFAAATMLLLRFVAIKIFGGRDYLRRYAAIILMIFFFSRRCC